MIIPGTGNWQLRGWERIITGNTALLDQKHFLIGSTRLRNEALILQDTLNYVGEQVDAIVAYDDASTDRTLEILRGHPKVVLIVTNEAWEEDIEARRIAEGRHRGLLLQNARAGLTFDWMFCFDADERVTGDLRGLARGLACWQFRRHTNSAFRCIYGPPTIARPIAPTANCWTFVDFLARNKGTF